MTEIPPRWRAEYWEPQQADYREARREVIFAAALFSAAAAGVARGGSSLLISSLPDHLLAVAALRTLAQAMAAGVRSGDDLDDVAARFAGLRAAGAQHGIRVRSRATGAFHRWGFERCPAGGAGHRRATDPPRTRRPRCRR